MSTEKNSEEKELWASIPRSEGVDRAESFVTLSHMAYERGDFKSALALCESAREIYESFKAVVSTQALLHVYEGITWSLRQLDREKEAAELALHAVAVLKEDSPGDATDMLREAGRFFFTAGEYEKSLDCHTKAMSEIDPDLTDWTIAIDNYNVGFAQMRLKKYPEAVLRQGFLFPLILHFVCGQSVQARLDSCPIQCQVGRCAVQTSWPENTS